MLKPQDKVVSPQTELKYWMMWRLNGIYDWFLCKKTTTLTSILKAIESLLSLLTENLLWNNWEIGNSHFIILNGNTKDSKKEVIYLGHTFEKGWKWISFQSAFCTGGYLCNQLYVIRHVQERTKHQSVTIVPNTYLNLWLQSFSLLNFCQMSWSLFLPVL